jgi:hypothetical protein
MGYYDDVAPTGGFLSWPSFDIFLANVAKAVSKAAAGEWFGIKYFAVNTKDSRHTGAHWVSIVLEIRPRDGSNVRAAAASGLPITVQERAGAPLPGIVVTGNVHINFQ